MIKNELLGLRAVEETDLGFLKEWRNIETFRKNFREVRELNSANQSNWFNKSCVNNPNDFMFIIVRLSDNKPIGAGGLLYINWIIRSADFSFYIGEDDLYIDELYAPSASLLLFKVAFQILNLNKIWMELYEFDLKKIQLYSNKFNFNKDGILRENCFHDGKYYNSYIFSLLRSEYNNLVSKIV